MVEGVRQGLKGRQFETPLAPPQPGHRLTEACVGSESLPVVTVSDAHPQGRRQRDTIKDPASN